MLTDEELRQLADARSLDELLSLLELFASEGKITEAEAETYYDQYAVPLEAMGDVLSSAPSTNQSPTISDIASLKQLPNELWSTLRNKPPASYRAPSLAPIPEGLSPQLGAYMEKQRNISATPVSAAAPVLPALAPEVQAYLEQYISNVDLANRLSNLVSQNLLDEAMAGSLYNSILGRSPISEAKALAEAKSYGFGIEEAQLAYDQAQAILDKQAGMYIRAGSGRNLTAQGKAQADREKRAGDLTEALNYTYNNPLIKPDDLVKAGITREAGEAFLSGQPSDIVNRLTTLNQQFQEKSNAEGQTAEALLAGLNKPRTKESYELPAIPEELPIAKSFLQGTGYGEGTKLRGFIADEIPDIAQEQRKNREAWWKALNTPATEPTTYGSEQERYRAEAENWGNVAAAAPSSEYAGGTYYGTGGLKAIAEQAYKSAQERLSGLRPEDYSAGMPNTEVPGEDPLVAALKRRKFISEYYRQPGTGLVPRLQPSARW